MALLFCLFCMAHSNIRAMHEHVKIIHKTKEIWLKRIAMAIDELGLLIITKDKLIDNCTIVIERLINHSD